MTIEEMRPSRTHRPSFPGTHHLLSPRPIPQDRDVVALSFPGAAVRWMAVIASVGLMLSGIYLIIDGVYGMGAGTVSQLFNMATHPFVGLAVGILATAAIQSSSTVTALTVAAVGSGAIPVEVAVPVILGANIGTTVTVAMVSFSYVGQRGEFRRAYTSASLHAAFNVLFVLILLPLELLFQPIQHLATFLSHLALGDEHDPTTTGVALSALVSPLIDTVGTRGLLGSLFEPRVAAAATLILGTTLVLTAVRVMSCQLRTLMAATTRTLIKRSSGASDLISIFSGMFITASVQASSVTVSSLLPFAASQSLKTRELLMVTMGANIGTTFLALFTSLAVPGSLGGFALEAALIHVLFNVIGTLLVLCIRPLRGLIVRAAEFGGRTAARGYMSTGVVIASFYFVVPAVILLAYIALS